MTQSFLRRPKLEEILGISRSGIYQRIKDGTLPAPVQVGARTVAWLSTEIDQVQSAIVTGASMDDLRVLVERMHRARGYAPDPVKRAHYDKLHAKRRATLQLRGGRSDVRVPASETPFEKQIQSRPSA